MTFDQYVAACVAWGSTPSRITREEWIPCPHCGVMPSQVHRRSCQTSGYYVFYSSLVVRLDNWPKDHRCVGDTCGRAKHGIRCANGECDIASGVFSPPDGHMIREAAENLRRWLNDAERNGIRGRVSVLYDRGRSPGDRWQVHIEIDEPTPEADGMTEWGGG